MPARRSRFIRGFTLIELVLGITVFAIVMTLITSLMAPQAGRSVDPIFQVRAAEFAQSLLSEIVSKSFDENSDRSGGELRCGEDIDGDGVTGADGDGDDMCACPADDSGCGSANTIGPDGEGRGEFDDVDDYHNFSQSGAGLTDSLGNALLDSDGEPLYSGYQADFNVFYDDNYDGQPDGDIGLVKAIRVQITTPGGQTLQFIGYRGNY
ncbi:hypothetical protein HMF8227_00283 [Saliniradius amylolyticus]|uniref:MSHA pilin protein MshD n=1 Tax=Saliniradius amylolyticus TaxID=2183582 RepID=A0A2S2DZH4_9ALTE|nr:type II secretion system protein [Saliniradius amylolyticus]AWL10791.1 hypothetical protein HMF8227_00283 [Saliniradius amylolyticus]